MQDGRSCCDAGGFYSSSEIAKENGKEVNNHSFWDRIRRLASNRYGCWILHGTLQFRQNRTSHSRSFWICIFNLGWREAERTPTINQTGVFRTENPEAVHGEKYIESIYYLQVKLVSGDGMVNNCRASVTVQQTPLTYLCGTWRLSKYESISISKARPEYLELFRLREYEDDRARQFVFYSASSLTDDFIQSFDIAENVIMVTWGSENGNIPKPHTKTIRDNG